MIVDALEGLDSGLSLTSTSKMSDLDDINRTLYDLAAQDLLDVWDTPMESEVGIRIFELCRFPCLKMKYLQFDISYNTSH